MPLPSNHPRCDRVVPEQPQGSKIGSVALVSFDGAWPNQTPIGFVVSLEPSTFSHFTLSPSLSALL
jgi:hypothetical protein